MIIPSTERHARRGGLGRAYDAWRKWFGGIAEAISVPEEDAARGPVEKIAAVTPPWLMSMAVHIVLMIAMGLVVLKVAEPMEEPLAVEVEFAEPPEVLDEEIYAETLGQQLEQPTDMFSSEGTADETLAIGEGLAMVDDPLSGPPTYHATPDGDMPFAAMNAPAIGLELTGREIGMKQALLDAYGGTALTEAAVEEGLRWLVRRQGSDGMWSLRGPYNNGSNQENEEAATAMALLAFQGAGYTPLSSEDRGFKKAINRGWAALLRRQQTDGQFFGDVASGHRLYTQAQCTIALCELYGMTRDEKYRDAAQRAIDYCVNIQSPEGGWRYEPGVDGDMSVTGWFVMALESARMAGLEVPSPTLLNVSAFLETVARDEGSQYAYRTRDAASLSMTAEGLLCRQYLGWKRDDSRLRQGVENLVSNLPEWDKRNVYYWYYATQVCHHMEGDVWRSWNEVTRQLLPKKQEKRGVERGSWNPKGDRWGNAGGRLYVTCLSLYILEVYYRHLPIYRSASLGL